VCSGQPYDARGWAAATKGVPVTATKDVTTTTYNALRLPASVMTGPRWVVRMVRE
jgi:hypothetical protein